MCEEDPERADGTADAASGLVRVLAGTRGQGRLGKMA
jgi:hypothetical protein